MPKKKMRISYNPAEIVRGKREWYIKYYQTNPATGKKERFRFYNLNSIKDLDEREEFAQDMVLEINSKLPLGWPFEDVFQELPARTNILTALELAVRVSANSDRKNTNRNFTSMLQIFSAWLRVENLDQIRIGEFRKKHAIAFLDHAEFKRQISNRTYNNYLERLTRLFAELKKRDFVKKNYWKKFKRRKVHGKQRRAFNKWEREVVAQEIAATDPWLMLGVLLQYHCFIRPVELRRLRFYMIDISEGVINLTAQETKNRENDHVTIPDVLLPFLKDFQFSRWDDQWLLFGEGGHPHPSKCCSHDLLNSRHKRVLDRLHKENKLRNTKGLSFYSWKDTGAMVLFKNKVNLLEIMRQLRHKDLATTQKYCQALYMINEEIKTLNNALISSYRVA